jgi:DegV family protein with EDD domain
MKNCLVIDSSYGITNGQYENVYVLPLIIIENKGSETVEYLDGVDITTSEVIEKLNNGANFSTSQPNIGTMMELFDKLSNEYDAIHVLPIPKSISGNYNTAVSVAKDYKNVYVYNQTLVSTYAKWTILDLLELDKQGKLNKESIEQYLAHSYNHKIGAVIVPDPSYLIKGGRMSGAKGLIVGLLGLKLVITLFEDEGLKFFGKSLTDKKAIELIKKAFEEKVNYSPKNVKRVAILYSPNNDPKFNIKEIVKLMEDNFSFEGIEIQMGELPIAIICHLGPNYAVVGIEV